MPTPEAVAAPRFLDQLAQEFQGLAAEVGQLQDTVSDVLSGAAIEPRLLQQAQALDIVHQHMRELAAILARAATQASPEWRLAIEPVLAGVSLSSLARRLAGGDTEAADSGELELL